MLVKAVPDLNVFLERVDANLSMWKALAAADSRGTSTNNSGRAVRTDTGRIRMNTDTGRIRTDK